MLSHSESLLESDKHLKRIGPVFGLLPVLLNNLLMHVQCSTEVVHLNSYTKMIITHARVTLDNGLEHTDYLRRHSSFQQSVPEYHVLRLGFHFDFSVQLHLRVHVVQIRQIDTHLLTGRIRATPAPGHHLLLWPCHARSHWGTAHWRSWQSALHRRRQLLARTARGRTHGLL